MGGTFIRCTVFVVPLQCCGLGDSQTAKSMQWSWVEFESKRTERQKEREKECVCVCVCLCLCLCMSVYVSMSAWTHREWILNVTYSDIAVSYKFISHYACAQCLRTWNWKHWMWLLPCQQRYLVHVLGDELCNQLGHVLCQLRRLQDTAVPCSTAAQLSHQHSLYTVKPLFKGHSKNQAKVHLVRGSFHYMDVWSFQEKVVLKDLQYLVRS